MAIPVCNLAKAKKLSQHIKIHGVDWCSKAVAFYRTKILDNQQMKKKQQRESTQ
jgi:hypothetical protein